MKRIFMILTPLIFLILLNTAHAQEKKASTGYPWGGTVYDSRTKKTTSIEVDADGARKKIVRDEAGKVILEEISYPDDFMVPWAESHDPKTGETTLSEADLFTGSHVVTKFDREGNVISSRMEHQYITGDDAVAILESERERIQWMFNWMNWRYGEGSEGTLYVAFLQRGVKGDSALSYAKSWNAQLLVWVDDASYFYKDHLDALNASIAHVKGQARVYSGDTAYIVQGVDAWVKIEDKLESLFEEMIGQKAEEAYELDQAIGYADQESKVEDKYLTQGLQVGEGYDYSKAEKEKEAEIKPLREKNKEHTKRADEAFKKSQSIREEIVNLSKTRVFSSLSDSERIKVPEIPEETAEASPEAPKPVESASEPPQSETEPAQEIAEEEAQPVKSEREILEDKLSQAKNELQDIKNELDELTMKKIDNALETQALDDLNRERIHQMRSQSYGEMAKELEGLKGDELKRAFHRALEEAVNAKKLLYKEPGAPAPSSWPLPVREGLSEAEEEAYNKSYERQIAKMSLIMRRLGDDFSERALGTQTGYEILKEMKGAADADREQIIKGLSAAGWEGIGADSYVRDLEEQLRELKQ